MPKAYLNALSEGSKREIFEWLCKVDAENDQLRGELSKLSDIDAMVNRFLSWPLPDSVCSDGCVTQRDYGKAEGWPKRSGTNLLTADEARQMFTHVLKVMA